MMKALTCSARAAACVLMMIGLPLGAYAGQRAVVGQKAADGSVTLYTQRFQETLGDGTSVADIAVRTVDGHLQLTRKSYPGGECRTQATAIVDQAGFPVAAGPSSGSKPLFIVDDEPVLLVRCTDAGCKARSGTPSRPRAVQRLVGPTRLHSAAISAPATRSRRVRSTRASGLNANARPPWQARSFSSNGSTRPTSSRTIDDR